MASMMGDDGMMASALILMNGEIFMVVRDEKYSCWLPTHEVVNWREDQPLLQFRETAAHVTTMHNTSLLLGENYTVGININIYGRNLGSPTYGCNLSIELM